MKQLRRMLGIRPSIADERIWWDQFTWAETHMTSSTPQRQRVGRQLLAELAHTAPLVEDRELTETVLDTACR